MHEGKFRPLTSTGNDSGTFLNSDCTPHYACILIIEIRLLFFEIIHIPKSAVYIV